MHRPPPPKPSPAMGITSQMAASPLGLFTFNRKTGKWEQLSQGFCLCCEGTSLGGKRCQEWLDVDNSSPACCEIPETEGLQIQDYSSRNRGVANWACLGSALWITFPTPSPDNARVSGTALQPPARQDISNTHVTWTNLSLLHSTTPSGLVVLCLALELENHLLSTNIAEGCEFCGLQC